MVVCRGQPPLGVRAHMNDALADLSGAGAINVVASFASIGIIQDAVKSSGVGGNICRLYDASKISSVSDDLHCSKDYSVIAADFAVDDPPSSMIAVGDSFKRDMPGNGMVFIFEPEAMCYSAHVTRRIIECLAVAGEGNFRLGFDVLRGRNNAARIKEDAPYKFTANLYINEGPVVLVEEYASLGPDHL